MANKVLVETSARHVHVTREALNILFGEGYELTVKKMLSQPGQYASAERIDVVGPKKTLSGVSILGPVRPETQVELSLTDARSISPIVYGPDWSFHDFGRVPLEERERIDYVFINQGFQVLRYGVLAEQENEAFLSDHAPVLVTLK